MCGFNGTLGFNPKKISVIPTIQIDKNKLHPTQREFSYRSQLTAQHMCFTFPFVIHCVSHLVALFLRTQQQNSRHSYLLLDS